MDDFIKWACTIAAIAGLIWTVSYCASCHDEMNARTKVMQEYLGETIIIEGDTAMILDYDALEGKLILSNDKEVRLELVQKILGDKKPKFKSEENGDERTF